MAAPSTIPTWMPLLLKILPVTTDLLRRPSVKGCAYWLGIARQIARFALFPLRLRQIDANVSKLQRSRRLRWARSSGPGGIFVASIKCNPDPARLSPDDVTLVI